MDSLPPLFAGGTNSVCAYQHTGPSCCDWSTYDHVLVPSLVDDESTSPDSFIGGKVSHCLFTLIASLSSISPQYNCTDVGTVLYSEIPNDVVDLVMDYPESNAVSAFVHPKSLYRSPTLLLYSIPHPKLHMCLTVRS